MISCIDEVNNTFPACPGTIQSGTVSPSVVGNGTQVTSYDQSTQSIVTNLPQPYELGEIITFTLGAGASLNFSTSSTLSPTVPEPASVVLLGSMLLGVTGLLRKRFKRNA
jgi:hypothetical protein